jgi:hypothetical protein
MKKSARSLTVVKMKPPQKTAALGGDYIAMAIERNMPPEILSKLIDNAARIDGIKARKAFDSAMAAATAELPVVVKDRVMSFGEDRPGYKFEDLAGIIAAVKPFLNKYKLGFRFRTESIDDRIKVTCILFHEDGHSEENSLMAHADMSGKKNAIQGLGSAQTYLQRYTLKAALGLAAAADNDGNDVKKLQNPVPKKTEPKLEPKKVEAPHDPETGEIKGPHAIAVPLKGDGESDWIGFGALMVAAVKNVKDGNEVDNWIDKNDASLSGMEAIAPKVYKRLMSAIGRPVT